MTFLQAFVPQRSGLVWSWIIAALVGLGSADCRSHAVTPGAKAFDEQVRPFLVKHCQGCHGGEKPKADFRIDRLTPDFSKKVNRDHWQAVREQLQTGAMPPKDKPRPPEDGRKAVSAWIGARVEAFDAARRAAHGRVVLRRLNRVEYENTMHDLLGVDIDLKSQMPEDGAADGFDNVGAALHTSSFLMEKYLEAADRALNIAIVNRPKPAGIKKRYSLKDQHYVKHSEEDVYRLLDDTVVCFCSSEWRTVTLSQFYPNQEADRGRYRFRISASAVQSEGKPVTFRVGSTTRGGRMAGKGGVVGYFDAPADKPTIFEFIEYIEPRHTISILPYGLAGANVVKKEGAARWKGPGLAVQWVEVEGPLHDTWPPPGHRRIFGELAQAPAPSNSRERVEVVSKDPTADAERILRNFARRAFRRAVSDDDVKPYLTLVKNKLADKYTFEQAVRVGLLNILISPNFLFLREKPGKLDDFALASRLSYFLWSTMPDDELLGLAEQKKLGQSDTLHQQVERMLKDPKTTAFTENFVGQWLALRDIDFTEPSHLIYPEFDHLLKVSMIRETELFFEEILKKDLSLTNFVASDFSMLNGRLAKHYGIPGVDGSWDFRKVTLPRDSHRGGVMTMASVLKVTADGTNTTPVKRGAWIMDRLLGNPPPPPPADVPSLAPDIRGATTIRELLAKHRAGSCAACHAKFDFAGFALESFDVVGGWRDRYRTSGNGTEVIVDGRRMHYRLGKKVDPSDVMPDGKRFQNVDEFKQLLLNDKDQIARSLAAKLLTYGTGGPLEPADKPEIETIVRKVRDQTYGFRTMIHEVVQSKVFQNK